MPKKLRNIIFFFLLGIVFLGSASAQTTENRTITLPGQSVKIKSQEPSESFKNDLEMENRGKNQKNLYFWWLIQLVFLVTTSYLVYVIRKNKLNAKIGTDFEILE